MIIKTTFINYIKSWHCITFISEAISQILDFKQLLEGCLEAEGPEALEALFASIASADSDCGSAQKGGSEDDHWNITLHYISLHWFVTWLARPRFMYATFIQ